MNPMNMNELQQPQLTLGLFKKNEPNDLQQYQKGKKSTVPGEQEWDGDITNIFINECKKNPENYFNFGFTSEDFKSYLMKILYCRSMRSFIQRKRIQKIDQYNQKNRQAFSFGNTNQQ